MSEGSFSFAELRTARPIDLPGVEFVTASDGVRLAYRRYVPASPRAVVLFYHGGGAYSGAGYQHVGHGLQAQSDAVVYTPDIRGHGASGGERGDAPDPKQVWADIDTFVGQARAEYPGLPFFLGGHSSGAGLTLNYSSQPGHDSPDGYLFLSPQLGIRSLTQRETLAAPFAAVDGSAFAAYAESGGLEHGHDHAVRFNYPTQVLAADAGMVASITVNMSISLTPFSPHQQFAALDRPFGLWIGADDELFDPEKVLAFAELAGAVRARSQAGVIPDANHLSVLLRAHETIATWIVETGSRKVRG